MAMAAETLDSLLPHPVWDDVLDLPWGEEAAVFVQALASNWVTRTPRPAGERIFFTLSDVGTSLYHSAEEHFLLSLDSGLLEEFHQMTRAMPSKERHHANMLVPMTFAGLVALETLRALPAREWLAASSRRVFLMGFPDAGMMAVASVESDGITVCPQYTIEEV